MENYICINGKKLELTEDQLKQLGVLTKPKAIIEGDIAKIGDKELLYEFIVLERNDEEVKLLLKDTFCRCEFGESNNNFAESFVRGTLETFESMIANIVGADNLIEHTVDLTSDDGLKDYGTVNAKMSLLTCDMYRKYVYLLDKYPVDKWWWLATPCSTKTHDWETAVKCVSPSGIIYYDNYFLNVSGVRPFCILKSHIFGSHEE